MPTSPIPCETATMTKREDVAGEAGRAAAKAAAAAGVRIAELTELHQLRRASEIFSAIWSRSPNDAPPLPVEVMRAMSHAGNYVSGAFAPDGEMLGALCGFLGRQGGDVVLHSHILGVLPKTQSRSLGFALKEHQRAWSLQNGIDEVLWTFDPLVSRNAYFNLTKLGADADAYYVNFYGEMNDGINAGEESDRVLIVWRLQSKRARSAADQSLAEPDPQAILSSGAQVVLAPDPRGAPVGESPSADTVLCKIPADIVELRGRDRALARAWRLAVRETLGVALEDGYRVQGVSRSGWYSLKRGSGRA